MLFNAKAILLEEQFWYYLTLSWEDKGVHTFPKGICPKMNVLARQEYELAYYDSAVHRFNHYTTRTPLSFSYCSKRTNYNWYNCHLHVTSFFQFPSKVEVLILLFNFFQFYSVVSRDSKVDNFASSLFFCSL